VPVRQLEASAPLHIFIAMKMHHRINHMFHNLACLAEEVVVIV
jgi:hypothetical protein